MRLDRILLVQQSMGRHLIRRQHVNEVKKALSLAMRRTPTAGERALWEALRGRRLEGYKFRRQQVVKGLIVDFYCEEAGIVVEVDGPVHTDNHEYDKERDIILKDLGLRIIRVTNEDVLGNLGSVQEKIVDALKKSQPELPHPPNPLLPQGEGGD